MLPRVAKLSQKELNSLLLFPNPVVSEATYYLPPLPKGDRLVIYDGQGNRTAAQPIEAQQRIGQLNVGNLPNGVYVVALQHNDQILTTA